MSSDSGLGGVLAFFDTLPTHHRQTAIAVHTYLTGLPGVTCKIKYHIPFYKAGRDLCYIGPAHGLELSFMEAQYMQDPGHKLLWRGRTTVAGIDLTQPDSLDWDVLEQFIRQALDIDARIAAMELRPSTAPKGKR